MNYIRQYLFLICVFLLSSCNKNTHVFKRLPDGPINHHLIVVAKTKTGIKARGFKGATPKLSKIFFEVDKETKSLTSKDDGSFSFELPIKNKEFNAGTFTFNTNQKIHQSSYTFKELPHSLAQVAKTSFTIDNDLGSVGFIDNKVAILSSTAASVAIYEKSGDWVLPNDSEKTISLFEDTPQNFGAQMIDGKDNIALVPLFSTSELALIDVTSGKTISRSILKDENANTYLFDLTPQLTVKEPIDADKSGTKVTTITRSFAHNAQSVLALGDGYFLASFVNYYQFSDSQKGTESVVGPGIVALLKVEDKSISTKKIINLPFLNPMYLIRKDENTIWVSCSGAWSFEANQVLKTRGAGLVRLKFTQSTDGLEVEHKIDLKDFASGRPAFLDNKIILPRSWKNEIGILSDTATSNFDIEIKTPKFHRLFQFTFASHWHDDIFMLGESSGTLVAYSLSQGFFPFPFSEPIRLNSDQDSRIVLNPQAIHFRHQVNGHGISDEYQEGYQAWVTSPSQNKIIPLDFLEVFGP